MPPQPTAIRNIMKLLLKLCLDGAQEWLGEQAGMGRLLMVNGRIEGFMERGHEKRVIPTWFR